MTQQLAVPGPKPRMELYIVLEVHNDALRAVWTLRQTDWPAGQHMLYHVSLTPFN